MSRTSWFTQRRTKERFAFLVIRFFRAHSAFQGIYEDYKAVEELQLGFHGAGLFQRVRDLEQEVVFEIKETAHALFRREPPEDAGDADTEGPGGAGATTEGTFAELERALLSRNDAEGFQEHTRCLFSALRRSLVSRSLDAYIGTGFHMFMILVESLYQLENYAPRYAQEMEQVQRIEYLTQRIGYDLGEEEEHELRHIREVAQLCQGISEDTRELASIALERCRSLFRETAEVIRHSIEEAAENEVLVLNLLREHGLVDSVYGAGECDAILEHMFRSVQHSGLTGRQAAEKYARERCGNVEGLRPE
jgi:hypothetical protein